MRTIKFRAWDKALKTMSYSPLHSIGFDGKLYYGNADFKDYPVELMQFTGLLDKNGVEIYEGDIVRCYDKSGEMVYDREVDFYEFRREIWSEVDETGRTKVEVLGNVYENPEIPHQ